MGNAVMVELRLDYLLMRGCPLEVGDIIKNFYTDLFEIRSKGDVEIYSDPSEHDDKRLIQSFAPRENNGSQPMPDDFPVAVSLKNGRKNTEPANYFEWRGNGLFVVKSWNPDLEKLIEQQIEYDKQQGIASSGIGGDLMYQGPKTDFKINKKGNSMPVYTQEMKEAGKAAPIGSKVQIINNSELDLEYGEDILGLELTVRSNPISTSGRTCIQVVEYEGIAYCFIPDMIFPFKSKEEVELGEAKKAQIDDLSVQYRDAFGDCETVAEMLEIMQENGDLAEIILPLESKQ